MFFNNFHGWLISHWADIEPWAWLAATLYSAFSYIKKKGMPKKVNKDVVRNKGHTKKRKKKK